MWGVTAHTPSGDSPTMRYLLVAAFVLTGVVSCGEQQVPAPTDCGTIDTCIPSGPLIRHPIMMMDRPE